VQKCIDKLREILIMLLICTTTFFNRGVAPIFLSLSILDLPFWLFPYIFNHQVGICCNFNVLTSKFAIDNTSQHIK